MLAALLVGVIALAIWRVKRDVPHDDGPELGLPLKILSLVTFGSFTLLYFFHALAPEASPMEPLSSRTHRTLPARSSFEPITTNMYAGLSGGVDLLYLPAFAIGRHSSAALVHFAFAIALALAIFAYGMRLKNRGWSGRRSSDLCEPGRRDRRHQRV